jgi:hypothetical protein
LMFVHSLRWSDDIALRERRHLRSWLRLVDGCRRAV